MRVFSSSLCLLTALLAGVSVSLTRSQAEASPYTWVPQTVGIYSGALSYDGGSDSVMTEFFLSDTGSLAGSLALIGSFTPGEDNQMILGSLNGCNILEERKILCHWNDANGVGDVEFSFSEDFDEFTGKWRVKGAEDWFTWTGSRLSDLPQVNIMN